MSQSATHYSQLIDKTLHFIAQQDWKETRLEFWNSLIIFLSQELEFEYALVSELKDDKSTVRTLGLCSGGELIPNIEYSLKGTPCENVLADKLCSYNKGIVELFPEDDLLVELEACSYVGIPLLNTKGLAIGLVAVLGKNPLKNKKATEAVLQLIATRCAHELEQKQNELKISMRQQQLESLVDDLSREISERKRTEEALSCSQARWKFALEGTGDGVWDWDVPSSRVFFSGQCKSMFGYAESEIGDTIEEWSSRVHPEDLARVMADLQPHLDNQTPHYHNEHRILCKDRSYKWILARGLVLDRDEAGNPIRMIGTQTDISERKRVELREAARIRTLTALGNQETLEEVLSALLLSLETEHSGNRGSILLHAASGALEVAVAPRLPTSFPEAIAGMEVGRGAFTGERVIATDIQSDPLWVDYRTLTNESPVAACWSEPIRGDNGLLLGYVTLFHPEARPPFQAELDSIEITAQLSALAIERKMAEATVSAQFTELQRWHSVTLDREQRVQALKSEVNELLRRHNETPRYDSVESQSRSSLQETAH